MSKDRAYQLPELTYERAVELLDECVAERGAGYVYHRPEVNYAGEAEGSDCYYVHSPAQQRSIAESYAECQLPLPKGMEPKKSDVCGCIVGLVLHKHGVPMHQLNQAGGASSLLYELMMTGIVPRVSMGTVRLLEVTQYHQDDGETWGEAVERAKAHGWESELPLVIKKDTDA